MFPFLKSQTPVSKGNKVMDKNAPKTETAASTTPAPVVVKVNPLAPHTVHIRTEKQKGGGKKVGLFTNLAEAEKVQADIIAAKVYDGEALTEKQTVVVAEYEKEAPISFTDWKEESSKEAEREAAIASLPPEMVERLRKAGAFRRGV